MSPRHYDPKYAYEVARRTDRGQMLFDLNDRGLMEAFLGVLAEAQRRYRVRIYHLHFMSNHYHGLFEAPTPLAFSRFLNFVHGRIAALVNATRPVPGAVWTRKFRPLPVSTDEKTLLQRMDYLTGQAVRAKLVHHPAQFPGASALDWLLFGVPVVGVWGRGKENSETTAEGSDAPPQESQNRAAEAGLRELKISKLPGFDGHDWPELHRQFVAMADRIAGVSLADLVAQGHPAKLAEVDQAKGQEDDSRDAEVPDLPPAGQDSRLGEEDVADPGMDAHDTRVTHTEPLMMHGDLTTAPLPKATLPDCTDPDTGEPLLRGPVAPKPGQQGKKKRRALLILSADEGIRQAYAEQLRDFAGKHGEAMERLRQRTREVQAGIRVRASVLFPPHSLLPGGLWQAGEVRRPTGSTGEANGLRSEKSLQGDDFYVGHPHRDQRQRSLAGQRSCRAPRARAADSASSSSTSRTRRRVQPGALASPPER